MTALYFPPITRLPYPKYRKRKERRRRELIIYYKGKAFNETSHGLRLDYKKGTVGFTYSTIICLTGLFLSSLWIARIFGILLSIIHQSPPSYLGGVSMEFACMHWEAISLIRRLIPGYTHLYFSIVLLRSGRDDDMDQDRGKVVYNMG